MKKIWLSAGIMFLLVPGLLTGCGIPQADYDSALSRITSAQQELQTARTELETLRTELEKTKSQLDSLKTELGNNKTELDSVSNELSESKSKITELAAGLKKAENELKASANEYEAFASDLKEKWASFDKVAALEYFIVGYWNAAAKNDEVQVAQMTARMTTYIDPIGDSSLNSLWDQAMAAAAKNQDSLFLQSFAALMERNSILFQERASIIRKKLGD